MRVFAVVLGVLYAAACGIPTVLYLNGYYGSTGLVKAGSLRTLPRGTNVGTVGTVEPGSPAARAGIAAGDVVVRADAEHAPAFAQVFDLVPAGRPIAYAVIRGSSRSVATMTPVRRAPAAGEAALIALQLARGLAIVLIGAALVLLRPSFMTAAFFALCLEFGELAHPFGNLELLLGTPLWLKEIALLLTAVVSGAGPAFAAIFCLRFPSGEPLTRWRPVERAMLGVGAATIAVYLAALLAGGTFTATGSALYRTFSIASWIGYAVAVAAFMVRFAHASGEDKARLRWVAIGLASFLVSYALFWIAENVPGAPSDLSTWSQFVNLLPLTVLYAIVRHRVIDVRLAGGRALAYGAVSAVPVAGFSILDWVLGNQLQQTRLAVALEVLVAVAFGFWVNASQRRIDELIESVFFHGRRLAEERLRRAARRFPHVDDAVALGEALVAEPYEALAVCWCALYRVGDGVYRRCAQRGDVRAAELVDGNATLVLELMVTGAPVEDGDVLAFPLLTRHDLIGYLLVGPKHDRERFDALERAALRNLTETAAATYDHLDAVERRREAERLARELADARRESELLREILGGERAPS